MIANFRAGGPIALDARNHDAIERLLERVRSAGGIMPFVGAGLSVPFGFPGWRAFLERTGANARLSDRFLMSNVRADLDAGRFEKAAERIVQALGQARFNRYVTDAFSDDVLAAPPLAAVQMLPRLAHGPVVTTNFDRVLELTFRDAQRTFDLVLWGAKVQAASEALAEDLHILLKLHGDVGDGEDRVLSQDEYVHHYGSATSERVDLERPLPQLLQRLFQTRSLLFLGCSLQGDRYLELLRKMSGSGSDLEHFACVEAPNSRASLGEREAFLRAHFVTPIWIPAGQYEALIQFLALLGEASTALASRPGIPLSFRRPRQRSEDSRKLARAHEHRTGIRKRWSSLTSAEQKIAYLRRHGEELYNAGFYRDYLDLARDAAHAAMTIDAWSDRAEFLYNMHLAYRALGGRRNIARADSCLEAAERTLQRCPLSGLHGKVAHDLAFLAAERGHLRAAVVGFRAAAKLMHRAGDTRVGSTWLGLGRALERLGQRGARIRYAKQAIAYSARHHEPEEEARGWLALAEAYGDRGQSGPAREGQERAIELLRTNGDYRTLTRALNDLGASYHDDGQPHLALRYFLRGLWWDQQIEHREGVASGLSNIAWLHWEAWQGDRPGIMSTETREASLRKSVEYFSQAIVVQRSAGERLEVARLLVYRSMPLGGLGQTEEALSDIRNALPMLRRHQDETSIAVALNNRGTVEEKLGRKTAAIRSYRAAIEHAKGGPEIGIRRTAQRNLALLEAPSKARNGARSRRPKEVPR